MATFVLVHGGGGSAWDWHRLIPELAASGHDVVAPDLPIEDASAGFTEFRDAIVQAIGSRRDDLVVVGHSYGGFTAPLIVEMLPVRLLVLLCAMIPALGEKPADWWTNVEHPDMPELSVEEQFFNGVPADVVAQASAHEREQVSGEWNEPWPLAAWPDVATKVLIGRDDRFFPADFQPRVAKERLGVTPDEIDGGHAVALSHPKELATRLTSYLRDSMPHRPRS